MSRRVTDTFSWAVHFLSGPVCKFLIQPQQSLSLCAPTIFTFVGEMHTQHGGIFTSAIKRENWGGGCFAVAAGCIWIVQWVGPFSCLTGMVLFGLTDQKREKISQHHENQRLSSEQISPFVLFNSNQRITRNVCLTTAFTMHCSEAQSRPNKDR